MRLDYDFLALYFGSLRKTTHALNSRAALSESSTFVFSFASVQLFLVLNIAPLINLTQSNKTSINP